MRNIFNSQNQLFASFTAGFCAGWLAFISRAQFLLEGWHNILQIISLAGFTYCAFVLWIRMRPAIPRLPMTYFKVVGVLFIIGYMFIAGGAHIFQFTITRLGMVVNNLMPLICLLCGPALGLFTVRQRRILCLLFAPFLAIAVYTILAIDVTSIAAAADRMVAFEEVGVKTLYSYQVAMGSTAAVLLLYYITTVRSILISLGLASGMLFWLYTSMIYSKRQGLIEFVIVFGVLSLILIFGKDPNIRKIRQYLILGLGAIFIGAVGYALQGEAFTIMLQRIGVRFLLIGDQGIENLDRIREATLYFQNSSLFRIIIGQGMGGGSLEAFSLHSLHIGWANLVLKGGVILPLFYLIALTWNIVFLLHQPNFPNKLIAIFFSAYLMFRLSYSPSWSQLPSEIFLGLSFFAPEVFLASTRLKRQDSKASGR